MYFLRLPHLLALISAFTFIFASPAIDKRQFNDCSRLCVVPGSAANPDFGTCSSSDFTCLCKSQTFVQATINCISTQCSGSDQSAGHTQFELRCLQAGVSGFPSVTTPGITATGSRTVIELPTNTNTGTGTTVLTPTSSSPPSNTSTRSSAAGLHAVSIPTLLGIAIAVLPFLV